MAETNFPISNTPIVDENGRLTKEGRLFLRALWLASQGQFAGNITTTGDITSGGTVFAEQFVALTNGFFANENNVNALSQRDIFGDPQILTYFDSDSDQIIGPLNDDGKTCTFFTNAMNLVIRHVEWDFNEAAFPAGLNQTTIGNAPTVTYSGDSRIEFATAAVAPGDGVSIIANNVLTKTDRPTKIYMTWNMFASDDNTDFFIGLSDIAGTNQIGFTYSALSGLHSVVKTRVANGGSTNVQSTTQVNVVGRRNYLISFLGSGDVHFYVGNDISLNPAWPENTFLLAATVLASDPAMPSAGVLLKPFMRFQTNNVAQVRQLSLDKISCVFAW